MPSVQRRARNTRRGVRQKPPRGLIIMTALVPTIGHQYAIEVAAHHMKQRHGQLHVVVNDRSFEPLSGTLRASAIAEQFAHMPWVHVINYTDDEAPQEDDGTQEFWDYWVAIAEKATGWSHFSHVFASEPYGKPYAAQLDAEFIPVDIAREVFHTKGTDVRASILSRWAEVMPMFRKHLVRRIVFFGADSCGKTTMARTFAGDHWGFGGTFLPEWARPYLETVGEEVTLDKMENIIYTQFATQNAVSSSVDSPWVFMDTDLLTTLGYHRIYKMEPKCGMNRLEQMVRESHGHLYIVMNDGIPFTADPLRYGGDKRESNTKFWTDLLDEFGFDYYVVQNTDKIKQIHEIGDVIAKFQRDTFQVISKFVRE